MLRTPALINMKRGGPEKQVQALTSGAVVAEVLIRCRRRYLCQEEPAREGSLAAVRFLRWNMSRKDEWTRADKLNLAALVLGLAGLMFEVLVCLL